MKKTLWLAAPFLMLPALSAQAQSSEFNLICSAQAAWCNMLAVTFEKSQGVKVNMTLKGSGEAIAQIMAERANPKTDLWFGGTGDPHLQAAEQGLSMEYKSPTLPKLHDWAQKQAQQSGYKTVGIYSGPLGFGYNTELLAKKKLAVPKTWADLLKPEYKGEIQSANPASSGTAYTMIATLVQLMGEDQAFEYLKKLHGNIGAYTRSGTGPIKAVARGEATISISFVHDGPGEKAQGFPLETITPADGTGAEIGSMSIIKDARNPDSAKQFYDWALSAEMQGKAKDVKSFQLPSNKSAEVSELTPDLSTITLIDYDFKKYGSSDERKRLLQKWDTEVSSLPQ